MRRIVVATLSVFALVGCSDKPRGPDGREAEIYMAGLGGRGVVLRAGQSANVIYAEAIAQKANGDCAGAATKLRPVANLGPGYENAQTALGECLLQVGTDLTSDYLEGLTWLRRAADAGWPEAQLRLASAHALGPQTIRNPEEAGYWLALYNDNTGKSRVGFTPPPARDIAAIVAAIPAPAKAAGVARAASWQRKVWLPPNPPPTPGPESKGRRGRGFQDRERGVNG